MQLYTEDTQVAARFPDLKPALQKQAATVEAHRCLNCFDAPCTTACPTHIDIPRFIKKIASGNVTGSAQSILEANVLAVSCARVCPVEVLCEGSCVMHGHNHKPIEIGRLQRFAMESYYNAGGKIPLRSRPELPQRVVCIGAGPASLSCAAELRQLGLQVTVLDKRSLPGGLNTYGVAEYKLRASDSLAEIEQIRALGVEFRTGEIADLESLTRLESEYEAIFLGVGLGAMRKLSIPGGDHPAVVDALEFIASYKAGTPRMPGRAVIVIGAGNTAMDAAIAACRLGADNVRVIYRRGPENISAFDFEYEHASSEGVHFVWNTLPLAFYPAAAKNGRHYLECIELRSDVSGLLMPVTHSEFRIACDLVIPAIGQTPLIELLAELRGVRLDGNQVVTDRATGRTSNSRYFAGGDCANGGREVVDAVADGKRAARGIAAVIAPHTLVEVAHG